MSWIEIIAYDAADDRLRAQYDKVKGPDGKVDNVLAVHSLRPHTMDGHMGLYRQVLHSPHNTLPKWFLEALGVWVSQLNGCGYCRTHHFAGMRRLMRDDARANAISAAIDSRDIASAPLDAAQKLAFRYAEILTLAPAAVGADIIDQLRTAGLSDGEILEINQVSAYFSYANRTVLGLGCALEAGTQG
ncbi:MAG: peroxidase-related enzyme [Paracoccaceae bacterium]|nr:peroxidase-related enzyme [Paracoccaceae bacterium]